MNLYFAFNQNEIIHLRNLKANQLFQFTQDDQEMIFCHNPEWIAGKDADPVDVLQGEIGSRHPDRFQFSMKPIRFVIRMEDIRKAKAREPIFCEIVKPDEYTTWLGYYQYRNF